MSESGYVVYGAVGWEPMISGYKASYEAALAGLAQWMIPPVGAPMSNNLSVDPVVLHGFICAVPAGFVPPPPPEGVFLASEGVALALQGAVG